MGGISRSFLVTVAVLVALASGDSAAGGDAQRITLTVVYDSRTESDSLETDWGFACVVDGFQKRILFDAGANGRILLHNLKELEIDPASIDLIFISHRHWDHVGGLGTLILQNRDAQVVMLESSPDELLTTIRSLGGKILPVIGSTELCPGVRTGGEMGSSIKEQALVLDAADGLVVLTGCSHPDICTMLEEIKETEGKPISLVLGGFHLLRKSDGEMEEILRKFNLLGVRGVGPGHCTGEEQIEMFRESYGERFTEVGVGTVVNLPTGSTSR